MTTTRCFLDFNRVCDRRCKAFSPEYSSPYDCRILHEVGKSNQNLGSIERQLREIGRELRS